MKEAFEDFLRTKLSPLIKEDTGFNKAGKYVYKKEGNGVCLFAVVEPDRFNYPGRYGFNIMLSLVGLTADHKPAATVMGAIKNGDIVVATVNLKELCGKAPAPYELKDNNDVELINIVKTDLAEQKVKEWLAIQNIADAERVMILPENRKFIYNLAVYLAMAGLKEKSREYFMMIKNQGSIVTQAAASLGIDLA